MTFISQLDSFPAGLKQIICVFFISNACSAKPMTSFYKTDSSRSPIGTTFKTFYGVSQTGCCGHCLLDNVCLGVNYQASTSVCELTTFSLKDVNVNKQEASGWAILSRAGPSDWILLFQGIPDIGTELDPFDSWLYGTDVTNDDVRCMTADVTGCPSHFRSKFTRFWNTFDNFEVRLSMYKDGAEAGYITFTGTGSNLESWFAIDKVVSTTWPNITDPRYAYNVVGPGTTYSTFSNHVFPLRRFVIFKRAYGCQDEGVLVVLAGIYEPAPCNYDYQPSYPRFLYSPTNTWVRFDLYEMHYADSMRIAVRLL